MPLARREIFQLFLLISVVPLQYFLSSQSVFNFTGSKSQVVRGIIEQYNYFFEKATETKLWSSLKRLWSLNGVSKTETVEDNHLVKQDLEKEEHFFSGSQEPRYERYAAILYRVGDVLVHKKAGYRAAVVGWDTTIQASDEWKKLFYKGKEEMMSEPHYLIAIDTRDRMVPQYGYVAQRFLEPASPGVRVIHPNIEQYFEFFNGKKFIPRPWLKEMYPRD